MKPEDLCKIFFNFARDYRNAETEIRKLKEQAEKEAKLKEKEEQKSKAIAEDGEVGEKKGTKLVDGTLKTLRANDAMDIMKMLRQRRKKRGSVNASPATHQRTSSKREALAASLRISASQKSQPWQKKIPE